MDAVVEPEPRGGSTARRLGSILIRLVFALFLIGLLAPAAAWSALAAEPEGFEGAAHSLTSDHGVGPLLTMVDGGPGSTVTSDITLTYRGAEPAFVRLYATSAGTGLARFLRVSITRGAVDDAGFAADRTDYTGLGIGVLYRGPLAGLPSSFASGLPDPGTWSDGGSHTYRFEITLVGDPRAQGLRASVSFRFEARPA
jgi:hypothetical protein